MVKEEKSFSYKIEGGVLEIKLGGEIDHHSAVRVRADIDGIIFEQRPRRVILDLSEISFMDSSGLGLIMGRYTLIKDFGGVLILRSPTAAVMRILTLAGMERMIGIEKASKEEVTNEEK